VLDSVVVVLEEVVVSVFPGVTTVVDGGLTTVVDGGATTVVDGAAGSRSMIVVLVEVGAVVGGCCVKKKIPITTASNATIPKISPAPPVERASESVAIKHPLL
jgi:hypothetical protein